MSADPQASKEGAMNGNKNATPEAPAPATSAPAAALLTADALAKERRETRAWQRKLLPWMLGFLICVAAFFLIATIYEFNFLNNSILTSEQAPSAIQVLPSTLDGESSAYQTVAQLEVAAKLEAYLLQQRYHQASISEMSRVWLQYLGFETGMILALVGAFFILGKITDTTPNNFEVSLKESFSTSLFTTSPGLILTLLGVILMVITLYIHHEIKVADAAIYVRGPNIAVVNPSSGAETPPPLDEPPADAPELTPAAPELAPLPTGN
jgi:hypothetical protein